MPDISMCANETCNFKEDCYRYTATPNQYRQSYGEFACKEKMGKDSYFWSNKLAKEAKAKRGEYYLDIKKKNK